MQNLESIITEWLKNNPLAFRYRLDKQVFTLIEVATGKEIQVDCKKVVDHRVTKNSQGYNDYLNLVFDNGNQLVLFHEGIAFPLCFQATGPLPDAPAVMSMPDYIRLFRNLKELVKEEDRKPEALMLFQILIASLDGARLIGLDIGYEEEELEKLLTEFEKGFTVEKAQGEPVKDIILDKE